MTYVTVSVAFRGASRLACRFLTSTDTSWDKGEGDAVPMLIGGCADFDGVEGTERYSWCWLRRMLGPAPLLALPSTLPARVLDVGGTRVFGVAGARLDSVCATLALSVVNEAAARSLPLLLPYCT